jgi:hypothetical protein
MKKLTYKEFAKRTEEISKARKIFIPHITDNISIAFELYQEILAEEEMQVSIPTSVGGNKSLSPIDDYERPKCPECQTELGLKINAIDIDGKVWPTAWACPSCLAEYYSEKTVNQWMEELVKNV